MMADVLNPPSCAIHFGLLIALCDCKTSIIVYNCRVYELPVRRNFMNRLKIPPPLATHHHPNSLKPSLLRTALLYRHATKANIPTFEGRKNRLRWIFLKRKLEASSLSNSAQLQIDNDKLKTGDTSNTEGESGIRFWNERVNETDSDPEEEGELDEGDLEEGQAKTR